MTQLLEKYSTFTLQCTLPFPCNLAYALNTAQTAHFTITISLLNSKAIGTFSVFIILNISATSVEADQPSFHFATISLFVICEADTSSYFYHSDYLLLFHSVLFFPSYLKCRYPPGSSFLFLYSFFNMVSIEDYIHIFCFSYVRGVTPKPLLTALITLPSSGPTFPTTFQAYLFGNPAVISKLR